MAVKLKAAAAYAGQDARLVSLPMIPPSAGANRETDPESRSQQAHSFRPILRSRHIADVGLRGRNISAADSIDNSRQINQRNCDRYIFETQLRNNTQNRVADCAAQLRKNEHGRRPYLSLMIPSIGAARNWQTE